MHRIIKAFLILFILLPALMPVSAQEKEALRLSYGADKWIALHFLLQAQLYSRNYYDEGESEDDAVWSRGAQLRRSRIILNGQVHKNIEFFYQTDDIFAGSQRQGAQYSTENTSGAGEPGDHTHKTTDSKGVYTQDAFINYKLSSEFEAAVGLICLPFMHHNRESAASLLGIDYNYAVVPISGTTNEWRDTGVEFRGLVQRKFDYKIGVFRGYSNDSDGDSTDNESETDSFPRFCGRVQINFQDPEEGFFYSGNYLGKKNIISVGGGFDYQKNAGILGNYFAWTGDATVDYKVADDFIVAFQGAYVSVRNQPDADIEDQFGYFAQLGVLFRQIQPVVRYQFWDADDIKISYMHFGLNYYIDGNNASLKAEYQNPMGKDHKAVSGEKKATLQCQIFI
ncbi:MAG: hypothetical protein JXN64_15395 [Spirochaetes bacterium]|nr:hypothetical protein [Spirochaetota bacterium]